MRLRTIYLLALFGSNALPSSCWIIGERSFRKHDLNLESFYHENYYKLEVFFEAVRKHLAVPKSVTSIDGLITEYAWDFNPEVLPEDRQREIILPQDILDYISVLHNQRIDPAGRAGPETRTRIDFYDNTGFREAFQPDIEGATAYAGWGPDEHMPKVQIKCMTNTPGKLYVSRGDVIAIIKVGLETSRNFDTSLLGWVVLRPPETSDEMTRHEKLDTAPVAVGKHGLVCAVHIRRDQSKSRAEAAVKVLKQEKIGTPGLGYHERPPKEKGGLETAYSRIVAEDWLADKYHVEENWN